jgi:hypothetical protein
VVLLVSWAAPVVALHLCERSRPTLLDMESITSSELGTTSSGIGQDVGMGADDFREQVASLLDLDEAELLVRLADEVVLGVGPLDPDRKRSVAQAWIDAQRERLRAAICGDLRIRVLRETASDDRVDLAAAVADLAATVTGKLAAATVAVLMVRTGLDNLCA